MHFKTVNKNKKARSVHSTTVCKKKEKEKNTERNIEEEEKQNKDLCVIKELQERF